MMKKLNILFLVLFAFLILSFVSCNADIYSREPGDYTGAGSNPVIDNYFTGEAPKNIDATKAYYSDRVVITFDAVPAADYYEVYRACVPRGVKVEDTTLEWSKLDYNLVDTGSRYVTYTDVIPINDRGEYYYCYKVRACSNVDYGNGVTVGEMSKVIEGWTLAAPLLLSASQGDYSDRVTLTWRQTEGVKGYLVYVLDSASSSWTIVNPDRLLPYIPGVETVSYDYVPSPLLYGKDLYFKVSSVSRGNEPSSMSVSRNGYTYIKGAPTQPKNAKASQGDYTDYIKLEWDKMSGDDKDQGFLWEVFRKTENSDDQLLFSFNGKDVSKFPANLKLEGSKYVYTDPAAGGLEYGVDYTYTIRATGKVENENGEIVDAIGQAVSVDGTLFAPPKNISIKANIPQDGPASFDFTIPTILGYKEEKGWTYVLYGRYNDGFSVGEFKEVATFSCESETTTFNYVFDEADKVNEFAISMRNSSGVETGRTDEIYSTVLSADAVSVEDVTVRSNIYDKNLVANENGVYPVLLAVDNLESFKTITVTARKADGSVVSTMQYSTDELVKNNFAIDSPSDPFEKYSYVISGESWFGRKTKESSPVEGYGALTPEKFIKVFEAYAMKPWEFAEKEGFPVQLVEKWKIENNSAYPGRYLHWKIDQHNMDSLGNISVPSEYHGGKLDYNSSTVQIVKGRVVFNLTNFGELEGICSNGQYVMNAVSIDGNSSDVSGTITVTGMYPAVIDFNSLSVSSYNFAGNYRLTMNNGLGTVDVKATAN